VQVFLEEEGEEDRVVILKDTTHPSGGAP